LGTTSGRFNLVPKILETPLGDLTPSKNFGNYLWEILSFPKTLETTSGRFNLVPKILGTTSGRFNLSQKI
jgi:hypothetical protein